MRTIFLLIIIGLSFKAIDSYGQLSESFSDMNFTSDPAWTGDTDKFEVLDPPTSGDGSIDETWNDDGQLLRSIPDSGDAALVTASTRAYGEWLFSIADGRGWAISGSNDFYVILMSDTNDPALLKDGNRDFNGYFFRFDGGEGDNFTLYKQTGTTSTLLLNTNYPDGDATASNTYSVKITRSATGEFQIYIELGLYQDPENLLGTVTDNDITTSAYFGLVTNIQNPGAERVAYLDEIITRDIVVDTQPPFVQTVQMSSPTTVDLILDEFTDSATAHNPANYNLQGIGAPQTAEYIFSQANEIRLTLTSPLDGNLATSIDISNVEDLEGNAMDTTIQYTTPPTLNQNIKESFTDFDLTNSPEWLGETTGFEILDPPTEGDGSFSPDYVTDGALMRSKPNQGNQAMTFETIRSFGQWSFTIADGANWSISGSNDFYVLLNASTSDPAMLKPDNMNFYGYYLRYDGGSDDSFVLYKQTGTTSTPIIETDYPAGSDGGTAQPFTVKITRTEAEGWSLYIDEGIYEQAYTLRGTSSDAEIITGNYFGLATNIGSPAEERVVYMDSIYIGEIIYDTIPPNLDKLQVLSSNQLQVTFTEPVDTTTTSVANFNAASAGSPQSLNFVESGKVITLYFPNDFPNREQDTLTITNIQDSEGNLMEDMSAVFTYFNPVPGDIVINEVLFDTYPQIGLPDYDFLEIYNRSGFAINLEHWTLQIGEDERTFPNFTLEDGAYLIVTSSAAVEEYENFGQTLGIITTSLLTNNGEMVSLKDSTGQTIHQIHYTQDWYHDSEKEEGGWSIEQIDPDNWCAQANNWQASTDPVGGTPGSLNAVDAENMDTLAPSVITVSALDEQTISVLFSETFPATEINSSHISITPDPGVMLFSQNEDNPRLWQIAISNPLPERTEISIQFSDITDYCGNTLTDSTISFYRVSSQFQQVVFNEILAEPNSENGIQYEFLELYNRDTLAVNIEGWTLHVGSRDWALPSATIEPAGYLLIMPEFMAAYPGVPENAIFIFDESDLTDGGTMLQLKGPEGKTVTWVDYDDDWHDNNLAEMGGYSLERIDMEHLCGNQKNWRTSTSENYGTPNQTNSVTASNPDTEAPLAMYYILPGDTTIQVEYDSPLWPDTAVNFIQTSALQIDSISIEHPAGKFLHIKLKQPLEADIEYNITLNQFRDCNDNPMESTTFSFERPVAPEQNDVVINELLFNPPSGCDDFVELYNISDHFLTLNQMYLAKLDDFGQPDDIVPATERSYILPPQTYYILTNAYDCLEENYSPVFRRQSLITSLPSLPNDKGSLLLMEPDGTIIDQFVYDEDMHHALLDDPDGVSLERISPLSASDNPSNWFSAAADAGFATPTRENSHYNQKPVDKDNISLENETLSPDGDGYQDFLKINYRFGQPGTVLNIRILNHRGLMVRHLLSNETVSNEGFTTWDGTDDNGHKLPLGIYIIYAEWFDESGNQESTKQTCVVAGGLK